MLSRTSLCINHRILSKTLRISQNLKSRSMHVTCRIINSGIKSHSSDKLSRYSPLLGSAFVRCINTDNTSINSFNDAGIQNPSSGIEQTIGGVQVSTTNIIDNVPVEAAPINLMDKIPDAPLPPAPEVMDTLAAVGEASFKSIGLGGWSPVGMVQQALEWVHIGWDIPWWGTIAIGTICVRTLMFPLVIFSQRNAGKMHNSMPGMQEIQARITEARSVGDQFAAAQATQELIAYMKKSDCNPMKSMIVPLCQFPIFISFFMALKGMSNLPVDSMRTGGLYWFTDLTVPDPYYILPLITAGTLFVTVKVGIDGPKLATLGMFRYVIQGLPIIVFPFTINFSSAIVWYWTATNLYSLLQVGFLRIPSVRKFFKIPLQIKHPANVLQPKKNFKDGFQDSWTNMKLAREMTDRQQLDRIQFNKAGRGPIEKTYAYNPNSGKIRVKKSQ